MKNSFLLILALPLVSLSAFAGTPAEDLFKANLNKPIVLKNSIDRSACTAKGIKVYDYEGDKGHLALQVNFSGKTVGQGNPYFNNYAFKKSWFSDELVYKFSATDIVFHEPSPTVEVIVRYEGNKITRIIKSVNDRVEADCE